MYAWMSFIELFVGASLLRLGVIKYSAGGAGHYGLINQVAISEASLFRLDILTWPSTFLWLRPTPILWLWAGMTIA